jgi:anti-sigma28 factor (negative regulator of flagellin synthesis)
MEVPDIKGLISIGAMRIDPRKGAAEPVDKPAAQPRDSVELSSEAASASRSLEAQQAQLRAATLERADMLAKLKLEYQSGSLQINSEAIAQEMMAEGIFDEFSGPAA